MHLWVRPWTHIANLVLNNKSPEAGDVVRVAFSVVTWDGNVRLVAGTIEGPWFDARGDLAKAIRVVRRFTTLAKIRNGTFIIYEDREDTVCLFDMVIINFAACVVVYVFNRSGGKRNIPRGHVLIEGKLNEVTINLLDLGLDEAKAKCTDERECTDNTIWNIAGVVVAREADVNDATIGDMVARGEPHTHLCTPALMPHDSSASVCGVMPRPRNQCDAESWNY